MQITDSIRDTINNIAHAYRELAAAKTNCVAVVDSEMDFLVAEHDGPLTIIDKKNIKKIAKSFAEGKGKVLEDECKSLARILGGSEE